jgi:hypothetical protein
MQWGTDKMEIMMDILVKLLQALVFALLSYVAWKQRETSRNNEIRRAIEKAEMEQKLRESDRLAQERLEQVENQQIKIQSEADQQKAQLQIVSDMATGSFRAQEQWQRVMDVNSERQLQAEQLQHEDRKLFIESIKKNTETTANLTEMLEIQSEHLGGFGRVMQHFENKLDTTLKTVEMSSRDNRTDIQNALGNNIKYQNQHDETLRSIMTAVQGLRSDVGSIVSSNEKQKNQTLQAIDAKIAAIERNVSNLISLRPEQLGLPAPNTTETNDNKKDIA